VDFSACAKPAGPLHAGRDAEACGLGGGSLRRSRRGPGEVGWHRRRGGDETLRVSAGGSERPSPSASSQIGLVEPMTRPPPQCGEAVDRGAECARTAPRRGPGRDGDEVNVVRGPLNEPTNDRFSACSMRFARRAGHGADSVREAYAVAYNATLDALSRMDRDFIVTRICERGLWPGPGR